MTNIKALEVNNNDRQEAEVITAQYIGILL